MLTIVEYVATLVLVVFLITAFLSLQPFAARDLVVVGRTTTESVSFELTFDTDSKHTREIDAELKQYLEENIRFVGNGVARVRSSKIEVTPKNVSVIIGKQEVTTPGAVMWAQLQWDTTSGSNHGENGTIYLVVDSPTYLAGSVSFRSGNSEDRRGGPFGSRSKELWNDVAIRDSPVQARSSGWSVLWHPAKQHRLGDIAVPRRTGPEKSAPHAGNWSSCDLFSQTVRGVERLVVCARERSVRGKRVALL